MIKRLILLIMLLSIPSVSLAYSVLDYFGDKTGPIISSDFDIGRPHRGDVRIPFIIKDDSTSVKKVAVYFDTRDVTRDVFFGDDQYKNSYAFNSEKMPDGKHTLTIVADDSSKKMNRSVQEIVFNIDNAAPLLTLASGGGIFAQGKTAYLYFNSSEPNIVIDGTFQAKEIRAYPYHKKYRAVIGFSIDDPGNKNYFMNVKAKDRAGNESDYHYKVYVKNTKFGVLSFTLHPKKVEMLMPDTIREDWQRIENVVVEENDRNYISGPFIKPTDGRVSMLFGINEFINGEESGKHRGLDFANHMGAPVWASNNGLVRLTERLPAHGNTVVVEHGEGIFTYYAHLSKILVKPGQFVKKGENIGLVGMTGVATGPHLHFAMNVHNLRVDPLQWLQGVIKD